MLFGGCIVSATFIVTEEFTVSPKTGFHFFQADVTQTSTWINHADKIDFIDAVGFIMYITSTESSDVELDVYVDDYSGEGANPTSIPGSATQVINGLVISPGTSVVSYAESVSAIEEIDELKRLAKIGRFDCYTTSTGDDGNTFFISTVTVVITFSASDT